MKNSRDDNKPQGPNNITRALIDASVDRGLREIEEDPKRSIRKLTDMGRMFIKGRFMDEVLSIQQSGREKRRNAEQELASIENELRQKMLEIRK